MQSENPFRSFWINVLEGFTQDMALYLFLALVVVLLIAIKEKIVFLVVVDVMFFLLLIGIILYKWGF